LPEPLNFSARILAKKSEPLERIPGPRKLVSATVLLMVASFLASPATNWRAVE
jgi:hypothetical protein